MFKIYLRYIVINILFVTCSPLWNTTRLLLGFEMIDFYRYILRMIKKHHPHVDRIPHYKKNTITGFLQFCYILSKCYSYPCRILSIRLYSFKFSWVLLLSSIWFFSVCTSSSFFFSIQFSSSSYTAFPSMINFLLIFTLSFICSRMPRDYFVFHIPTV